MTWALIGVFAMLVIGFAWLAYREHDVSKLISAANSQAATIELHRKTINSLLGRVGQLEAGLRQLRDDSYDGAPAGRHHPESVPS